MAKRSGKAGKTQRAPTPQRVAAMKAYKKTFGVEPKRSMSIKAMKTSVSQEGLRKSHAAAKAEQASRSRHMWGGGVDRPADQRGWKSDTNNPRAGKVYNTEQGWISTETADRLFEKARANGKTTESVPRTKGMSPQERHFKLDSYIKNKQRELIARGMRTDADVRVAQTRRNQLQTAAMKMQPEAYVRPNRLSPLPPTAPPTVPTADRIRSAMPSGQTVSRIMMGTGIAVAAGRGFQDAKAEGKTTGEAVIAGAKSAAVPAAIAAAPAISRGAHAFGNVALEISGDLLRSGGGITDFMLNFPILKAGLATGAAGGLAKGVGYAAGVVGRVAPYAMAAYGAYQGAKEDSNTIRGAMRGAARSFDPSAIFMKRGVVERGFDAVAGRATPRSQSFASANAAFTSAHAAPAHADGPSGVAAGKRGFGNPANQAAAQKAKGNDYKGPQ